MKTKPSIVVNNGKKMWLMPDGDYVPYLAGGSNDAPTVEDLQIKLKESESKTKEARDDAAKYRTKLRETESSFDGVDAEEYKTLKALKAESEEKEAIKKGEYEKLLIEKTSSFEEKIKLQSESANSWKLKYESKVVDDAVKMVANSNNAVNSDDVLTFVKSKYKTEVSDDGRVKLFNNGEVVTDGEGNPLTIEDAVKSLLDERSYLVKSSETGAGSSGGTGKASEKDMTPIDRIKKGLQNL